MNNECVIDEGLFCHSERSEGLLSFLVSRASSAKRSLTPSANDVLAGCADAVSQIIGAAVATRSKAEFSRAFDESFRPYVGLRLALAHFAKAVIKENVREQLVRESICEIEADFRDKGMAAFGATVRDQALFTVWTLRKINDLTVQINAVPVEKGSKERDEEFCTNFNLNVLRAQFSLDCLNMALEKEHPIYPEVQEELVDGLRTMVNAYTWARRGLEIRVPMEESAVSFSSLDDEDSALMDFAFSETSGLSDDERGGDAVS